MHMNSGLTAEDQHMPSYGNFGDVILGNPLQESPKEEDDKTP